MRVILNGSPRDVPDGLSLRGLVEHLELTDGPFAIEVNNCVVTRERHAQQYVQPGDVIEVVHFVGGG